MPTPSGPDRRDREAAVAGDHRGDAVERRRREVRVPEHLGVVVRVDVDEPGRDDVAGRVELAVAVEALADPDDAPVVDRHVGAPAGCSRAVDDRPPTDHQLSHGPP